MTKTDYGSTGPTLPPGRATTDNYSSKIELAYNGSREDLEPYVPADHRPLASNTSSVGALAHLLKASLGSGVLAMPLAFKNAGLLVGAIGTALIGFICAHAIHILVKTSQQLCVELKRPALGYADTCDLVFQMGPKPVRRFSTFARELADWALAVTHIGACCVYVVVVAESFKQVSDEYGGPNWSVTAFCGLTLVVLVPLTQINKLKYLVPFSALANVVWVAAIGISIYYCLRDPPNISERKLAAPITGIPNFISTSLFAMEGIGVVMPLENEMVKPTQFLGCPGVLNIAMMTVSVLYGCVGFAGYVQYGDGVRGSLTLNLPQDEILAQSAKILVACVMLLTFALIFYVPFDVVWRRLEPKVPDYIKHMVSTWPLDASFRLVMELWLSLIQPWRYTDNAINRDRFPQTNNNQEEGSHTLDASFTQYIAENFPAYTCILQLVLPRFMVLDLTSYKNAVMLFRLGKVFSQPHLVPILKGLEKAIIENNSAFYTSPDASFNTSTFDSSFSYNGMALHKWVAIARQAISELNLSPNFEYDPVWSDNKKHTSLDFVKKIAAAKLASEKHLENLERRMNQQHKGLWASIKHWLMLTADDEDAQALEECKKVPNYLNATIHFFADIFGLQESSLMPLEPVAEDITEHSSFANQTQFSQSITNKLRGKSKSITYMGDPDLMPIASYESTILVRMLYQIASRVNEVYHEEFTNLWNRNDFWGFVAREILQPPCTVHSYSRDVTNHQNIVSQNLPARLSLRKLGSQAFAFWVFVGYLFLRLFYSAGGLFYIFILFLMWTCLVFTKATCKMLRIIKV